MGKKGLWGKPQSAIAGNKRLTEKTRVVSNQGFLHRANLRGANQVAFAACTAMRHQTLADYFTLKWANHRQK